MPSRITARSRIRGHAGTAPWWEGRGAAKGAERAPVPRFPRLVSPSPWENGSSPAVLSLRCGV